ncbi:MAG: hypothetical protein JSW43_09680 [Gemmatimonadota bacterium]|nr:MAG: hypothetical protein JSW43_09680 [Gemmatimonadota bacterium]
MTDRRSFLTVLSAALAGTLGPPAAFAARGTAPSVRAEPTIFRANPDGRQVLVRFYVTGVDAPAGRLRVYDQRRRLLGTAGVIRSGEALYGELWLPLEVETTVQSELESPGVRGVLRSSHRLRPQQRWTVFWITVGDPRALEAELEQLSPVRRAVQAQIYRDSGVSANPLPLDEALDVSDHVTFLRMVRGAQRVEQRYGIPAGIAAVSTSAEALPPNVLLALTGSGIRLALHSWHGAPPLEWYEAPDGARVLAAAIPPRGHPRDLGFAASQDEMTRRVERWLTTTPLLLSPALGREEGLAFVVNTEPDDTQPAMLEAVRQWNQRFAYPRIVIGAGEELVAAIDGRRSALIPVAPGSYHAHDTLPDAAAMAAIVSLRAAERAAHAGRALQTLSERLGSAGRATPSERYDPHVALRSVAAQIPTTLPGTLVFNPSPYLRTDVALLPDGTEQVVTDVPELGYAFIVDQPRGAASSERLVAGADTPSNTLAGAHLRLELDPRSGAIGSLVSVPDGREWVRPGSDGLNAIPGSIVEGLAHETIPGVGTRLVARRWSPARGDVRTTVTVYDALPWIDITNDAAAVGERAMEYLFAFDLPGARAMWEVPAGHEDATAPVYYVAHLRWLTVSSQRGAALFRGLDAPFVSVMQDGTVLAHGPRGRVRYRLSVTSDPVDPTLATRFGWGAEPLLAARVDRQPTGRLPRHGPLVVVDQPGMAIVGLKPADDGNGIIVFVQELLGSSRFVTLGESVLTFQSGRRVDYLERDLGEVSDVPGGVAFDIAAWGVVAVRLLDVGLRSA